MKLTTPLITPRELKEELPSRIWQDRINLFRQEIKNSLNGKDDRLIAVLGPCSIHDPVSTLEYATRLQKLQREVNDEILLVMRLYFEKPRTTLGWRGYLTDPFLNGQLDPLNGLKKARRLLLELAELGVPVATEFLTPFMPLYYEDLISWGCIGARTSASPIHRQLASGLSMPCGFKNSIEGCIETAVQALYVASKPQEYLSIDNEGRVAFVETEGNSHCHLVLRGGKNGPNFQREKLFKAQLLLQEYELNSRIMVDCSHDNSGKDHTKQRDVFFSTLNEPNVFAVMLESHLFEGRQNLDQERLAYGVSLTDSCIGWSETEDLIFEASKKAHCATI